MSESDPIVFVIDDDPLIREGMQSLIKSVGLRVEVFASARDFLLAKRLDVSARRVLVVRMPGLSGLDLQRKWSDAHIETPIVSFLVTATFHRCRTRHFLESLLSQTGNGKSSKPRSQSPRAASRARLLP